MLDLKLKIFLNWENDFLDEGSDAEQEEPGASWRASGGSRLV